MRNFKKISSIVLVVAMLFTLFSVSVFATDSDVSIVFRSSADSADEITGAKAGKDVYADFYIASGNYNLATSFQFHSALDVTVDDVTLDARFNATDDLTVTGNTITVLKTKGFGQIDGSVPIMTVKFTIPADAQVGDLTVGTVDPGTCGIDGVQGGTFKYDGDVTIEVLDGFVATTATATAPGAFDFGTALEDVKAAIGTATVSDGGSKTEPGYEITWDEELEYNATVPGTYTLTGTVSPKGDDALASFEGTLPVSVSVTVSPIADGVVAPATGSIVVKEDKVYEDAAIIAALPTQLDITKDSYTDKIGVAWTVVDKANMGDIGTTATVTGTLNTASETGLFAVADTAVTGTVTVVAAEIDGGKITAKGTSPTSTPSVTAIFPEGTLAVGSVVTATLVKEDGSAYTYEDAPITVTTTIEEGDDLTEVKLRFAESLKTYGIGVGSKFAVKVEADGSVLLNGSGEDAMKTSSIKTVSATTGSAPGIGNPIGGRPVNPSTPDGEKPDGEKPDGEKPDGEKPDGTTGPFSDIPADDWAADYITTLKEAGIINGKTATEFDPDSNVTRAEFAKMIVTLLGVAPSKAESVFTDCAAGEWYTPYVTAAAEAGYILGVSETEFAPNAPITRQDASTILGRAINASGEGEVSFTDKADIADYALSYVQALAEMEILTGDDAGTFRPTDNISRRESAAIVARAYELGKKPAIEGDENLPGSEVAEDKNDASDEESKTAE